MELDESKKRIESLKSGIWAIDSVSPPLYSLFKKFEFHRDIFFLVHILRMKANVKCVRVLQTLGGSSSKWFGESPSINLSEG